MKDEEQTLVSVVIPTFKRADLLNRSLTSVLRQSYRHLEVIVIIDGHDPETLESLRQVDDPRVKAFSNETPLGGSDARNEGVRRSQGHWIAFLDDDDEWFQDKLEQQMRLAAASSYPFPVIGSRLIARTPTGDYVWPRRFPRPGEPISEYLLARRSLFQGEGLLQSSVILAKRELLLKCPFTSKLRMHQDNDWAIRAAMMQGVGFEFCPEPLAIWYREEGRRSIGNSPDWRFSLDWIHGLGEAVTPKAVAGFIATQVSNQASGAGDLRAFFLLLKELLRARVDPLYVGIHFSMWLLSPALRKWIRRILKRRASAEKL